MSSPGGWGLTNVSFAAVKAAQRHIFRFECDGVPILVDLQMKPGS